MMQTEPRWQYPDRNARSEPILFFKMLHHLIRDTSNPKILDKLDALLLDHAPMCTDFSGIFEAHQRMLDDTLLAPRISEALGNRVNMRFREHLQQRRFQIAALFLIEHEAEYQRLTTLPMTEFPEWGTDLPWKDVPRADYEVSRVTFRFGDHLKAAHFASGMQPATRIVIALQRYRLEHGQYPADLEALVPDFIEAIPKTPATTTRVFYEVAGDQYKLEDDGIAQLSGGSYFIAPEYVGLKDF